MSKKSLSLLIGFVVVVIICIVLFFILNDNSSFNNYSGGLTNDYDSSYTEEDMFENGEIPNVSVRFGYDGNEFVAIMEDNETSISLVRNITSAGRNLPIYNYDNFDGYEYYQYYDIPSSYDIPSEPVKVTSEKAGEIYYAEPNRIMIFYRDANIEGNFVKIGEIEDTTGLIDAVENNPVLEGWGNKIISVEYME